MGSINYDTPDWDLRAPLINIPANWCRLEASIGLLPVPKDLTNFLVPVASDYLLGFETDNTYRHCSWQAVVKIRPKITIKIGLTDWKTEAGISVPPRPMRPVLSATYFHLISLVAVLASLILFCSAGESSASPLAFSPPYFFSIVLKLYLFTLITITQITKKLSFRN